MFQSVSKRFDPIPVKKSKRSDTVPDMSYTPREIIAKFSRGERVPLGFQGKYDPDGASPFEEDPTRDPEFDFGDYVEEKKALEDRIEAKKRSKGKQNPPSKRKASAEELSVSDSMKRETISGDGGSAPEASD